MGSVYSREYKAFLGRLREARKAAAMTQAQVARALGRPQSFVSRSESGQRRVDVVELAAFARLYGKELGYFVTHGAGGKA
jgi:transcriptional regulator with XRE-family HTH domain